MPGMVPELAGLRRGQSALHSGTIETMCCHDLHSHSTASDGSLTPTQLVARAQRAGVDVLALTDHDTLDGLDEAARAAAGGALRLVSGVEVSVSWQSMTIHILGLNVDPGCQSLLQGLDRQLAFRDWRAGEIARRLEKAGIGGALEGAGRYRQGRILSRTHFAHFLVDVGRASSVRDVFKRYLVKGKPGFVGGEWASLEEALGWILDAGGLPVIAHPARYRLTRSKLARLIGEFRAAGGVGIEVVSGSHTLDETRHMAAVSREHHLLASAGSDYHGPHNPWVELGRLRDLPQGCIPVWEAADWPAAA
jgi:predicted metal-dependent phosphoesterase TrpH